VRVFIHHLQGVAKLRKNFPVGPSIHHLHSK
jgi:hypothetical protein